jgi:hypothetical protein
MTLSWNQFKNRIIMIRLELKRILRSVLVWVSLKVGSSQSLITIDRSIITIFFSVLINLSNKDWPSFKLLNWIKNIHITIKSCLHWSERFHKTIHFPRLRVVRRQNVGRWPLVSENLVSRDLRFLGDRFSGIVETEKEGENGSIFRSLPISDGL